MDLDHSFDLRALLRNHGSKSHKAKPMQFESVAVGIRKRLHNNLKLRRSSRLTTFDNARDLQVPSPIERPPQISESKRKIEYRKEQLIKWKEEKDKKKKEAALKKKKPFVTGIPSNTRVYVPPPPPRRQVLPSSSGRVTRSQTAQNQNDRVTKKSVYESFAPKNAGFRPPKLKNVLDISKLDITNNKNKKMAFKPVLPNVVPKTLRKSVTPKGAAGKAKLEIPKSESSSEERLRSPELSIHLQLTPEQISELSKAISPYVTKSRGKENARKEIKKKMEEGLFEEDSSDVYIDHFRNSVTSETNRIMEKCNMWEKIYEQVTLPDYVQELVLGAVGQGRLLVSKKMVQFSELVERCHSPESGQAPVTRADLHGFWDMVYMQVEDVDMRFKKIEDLKTRNWVEEKPDLVQRKVKPVLTKPKTKPAAKAKPTGPSRIQEMIAAARKAKQEGEQVASVLDTKTFSGGFFNVSSPLRTPPLLRTTSQTKSLLKDVLSNEANKASDSKKCASFAMLRASLLGKNVEFDGVEPLPVTPSHQVPAVTPGRSILKQQRSSADVKNKKSIKMVLFMQSDEESTASVLPDINNTKQKPDIPEKIVVSPMPTEDKEYKRFPLKRQDAIEVRRQTRKTRQNAATPTPTANPSADPKLLEEEKTPRRSTRRSARRAKEET